MVRLAQFPRSRSQSFAGGIKPVALALGVAFGLSVGAVPAASAASITVNNLSGTSVVGQCTLSDAVLAANTDAAVQGCAAGSGADTINFTVTGTISLPSELAITSDLTITGPGAASLTITPAGTNRSVHITATPTVTISGVTFLGNGTATVDGGAIFLHGSPGQTSLTVQNCVFTNNVTSSGDGGALFLYSGGAMNVLNSTFTGNQSTSRGGAIKFYDVGPTTVSGSTFSGNHVTGGRGGAMFFYKSGNTTVSDSTISGNTAGSTGVFGSGGGMFFYKTTGTLISGSTISGNTAENHAGGIYFYSGTGSQTIVNTTISGNTVNNGDGGGIVVNQQALTINNSTLTGNNAPGGVGGGVYLTDSGGQTLNLNSTIVANSTEQGGGTHDLAVGQGTLNATNSLVENATGLTFTVNTANIFGQDPLLGPLANNGGPTQTHALLLGSPAIDTGSNPTAQPFDQRGAGFVRTSGAATDIGAFETQGAPPPPPPVSVVGIPTLSQWGIGLLSVLMAGWAMLTGFGRRRRR